MKSNSTNKQVLAIVCSVFEAYSAILFLPDEDGETCHVAASFSLGDKILSNATIAPGKGLAGWILRNKQPLLVPNFDQHQSKLGYYTDDEESQIRAFMGCPIPTGGILCVDSKRQYSFSDKDHKILQLFATLVASQQTTAPSNDFMGDIPEYFAHLGILQDLRFRHKRWPEFLKHFLHTVADATHFDYCAFASINPSGESFTIEGESAPFLLKEQEYLSLPINSGIAGFVLRDERQPVFSEGTGASSTTASLFGKNVDLPHYTAVICLPIIVNKTARGVLCLGNTEPRIMDEALRSFVHQCVDHLALFLENLYLRTRIRALLPTATVHSHGAQAFNPDAATQYSPEEE